jgi:hypothetical protein
MRRASAPSALASPSPALHITAARSLLLPLTTPPRTERRAGRRWNMQPFNISCELPISTHSPLTENLKGHSPLFPFSLFLGDASSAAARQAAHKTTEKTTTDTHHLYPPAPNPPPNYSPSHFPSSQHLPLLPLRFPRSTAQQSPQHRNITTNACNNNNMI